MTINIEEGALISTEMVATLYPTNISIVEFRRVKGMQFKKGVVEEKTPVSGTIFDILASERGSAENSVVVPKELKGHLSDDRGREGHNTIKLKNSS
jgi:hypothetical protein